MINRVKDLFRDGAQKTGEFFGSILNNPQDDVMGPNPQVESGESPRSAPKLSRLKKLGKALKGASGYDNRKAAYDSYMNNLKLMKTGYQKLSGRIGMSSPGPRDATKIGQVGRTTNFEDTLRSWNSRMRKFAVQRYYASLGKK
tara:strand:+ start:403 stop:831 length:429 start_codon:yes stop_codon:yes gene_type:complete